VWKLPVNPASADLVERPPVRYSGGFDLLSPDQGFALARGADPPQDGALYITAADLVFCSVTEDHLEAWSIRCRFYAALERAGRPRIVFHYLRHQRGPAGPCGDSYAKPGGIAPRHRRRPGETAGRLACGGIGSALR
jgi:hypothetical protein